MSVPRKQTLSRGYLIFLCDLLLLFFGETVEFVSFTFAVVILSDSPYLVNDRLHLEFICLLLFVYLFFFSIIIVPTVFLVTNLNHTKLGQGKRFSCQQSDKNSTGYFSLCAEIGIILYNSISRLLLTL